MQVVAAISEFTKEELDELNCIYFHMLSARDSTPFEATLLQKLESMIENYCEHDGDIGKDYPAEKCMKCNRMWE